MPFEYIEYTDKQLDSLDLTISKDRLNRYLRLGSGDRKKAIQFYEVNNTSSEAFFGVIRGAEIPLRNAIHNVLTADIGQADWYDHIPFLLPRETASIAIAKDNIRKRQKSATPGRVIAELTLGFWCGLLSKVYDSRLWVPHLHKAFPHGKVGRRKAYERVEQVRRLRNSIAHHECILDNNLAQRHKDVLELVGWICPVTRQWVEANSTLADRLKDLANLLAPAISLAIAPATGISIAAQAETPEK